MGAARQYAVCGEANANRNECWRGNLDTASGAAELESNAEPAAGEAPFDCKAAPAAGEAPLDTKGQQQRA